MTDEIGVTFLGPLPNTDDAYHMALFYIHDGDTPEVIEFGPQIQPGAIAGAAEVMTEYFAGNQNDGSLFGLLLGGERAWNYASDPDLDYQVLATAPDLSAQWASLLSYANQVDTDGYEYRPIWQNSNTFVESALAYAGLPEPTPSGSNYATVINPQTGQTQTVWVPAAQYRLHDPVGNPITPPPLQESPYIFLNPNNGTTIVIPDPAPDVTLQWSGQNLTVTLSGDNPDTVSDATGYTLGTSGNVVLIASYNGSTLNANGSDALMLGGPGDDTFLLGYGGNDWVDGGAGNNTAIYSQSSDSYTITLAATNGVDTGPRNDQIVQVADNNTGGIDDLAMVENINFVNPGNTVMVLPLADGLPPPSDNTTISLGATNTNSNDVVNFSQYGGNVYLSSSSAQTPAIGLYGNSNFTQSLSYTFTDFNTLILGNGNNVLNLQKSDDPYLQLVETGNGNNTITGTIPGLTLDLGNGNNLVGSVGPGTIVNVQSNGVDQFVPSADELINGSTASDQLIGGNGVLHGAVGEVGSQDPWVVGPNQARYSINTDGDLVVQTPFEAAMNNGMTFISGYVGGPDVPLSEQTDGIFVGLAQITASLLIDLKRPFNEDISTWFKLGNELYYTSTGTTIFNADPLVFDLNGGGINLTALSSVAPMLDMEDTGFGMHTGWIEPNDGVLVLEQPGQNGSPDLTEMLGSTDGGPSGFAALEQYDVNGTGVLDASDPIWSQLMIWVDANGNGVVDPGELETLQQAGITSINLDATTQTNDTDAGNTILSTSTFTFANGTTGNVDQVNFNIDTFNTQYLGDTSVSAAAAAMPDLKGYGTLTDLQVAMTLDPSLIDVVNANLPNLDVVNLQSLVLAALPIFGAWAEAVELPDGSGGLQSVDPASGNSDIPILLSVDSDGNVSVADFGYEVTDQNGSYWALASGAPVLDPNSDPDDPTPIARPTFDQVLAQTPPAGETWVDFTAAEIGFIERYYGQPFPIDQTPSDPKALLAAMSDFMTGAYTGLSGDAVRLAMQGPLAQYFPGISYDVTTDSFTATTQEQLSPMYEAIFAGAPSDAAGATQWLSEWLPIINIVLGDFERAANIPVTYGYQFASMVHAFEQSNLPLTIEQVAVALGIPSGEVIEGGSTITGPDSPSIYYLHGGDQTVTAGVGLNNFVMGGTFGNDTIIDDEPSGYNDESILWFTNVASTDVTATRDGLNLILSVNGTDEQVTVENEFNGVEESFSGGNLADNWGVAQIEFSDGVLWDMPNIAEAVSRPEPDEPTILGTPGMDVLDGGVGGNNYLSGGNGSDIYMFGLGYGHDTIEVNRTDPFNGDIDTVYFGSGIAMSGLTFSRQGGSDDLTITVNSTGDTLPPAVPGETNCKLV